MKRLKQMLSALAATLLFSGVVLADTTITYQGRLDSGGAAFDGMVDMTFELYDAESGGSAVGPAVDVIGVAVGEGLFQVELDFGEQPFDAGLWLQVTVDGSVLSPRQKVTAAPLAVQALTDATTAGTGLSLNGTELFIHSRFRLPQGCGFNQVAKAQPGGLWACANDNTGGGGITGVTAGSGLQGGGTSGNVTLAADYAAVQARVVGGCAAGSSIRLIAQNGTVTCEPDDAGGLTLPFSGGASTGLSTAAFAVGNSGNGPAISATSQYPGDTAFIAAVRGRHSLNSGAGLGVEGSTASNRSGVAGVWGEATSTTGTVYGVRGKARSPDGYAGHFENSEGAGLFARGDWGEPDLVLHGIVSGSANRSEIRAMGLMDFHVPDFGGFDRVFRVRNSLNGNLLILENDGDMTIAGSLTQNSDRNAKQDIVPVDPAAVLDKLAALPVSTWRYTDDPDTPHMGPMAQDFHAAFGLGNTDTGINALDADGVALAAIQGLVLQVREQDARIAELEAALGDLLARDRRTTRRQP